MSNRNKFHKKRKYNKWFKMNFVMKFAPCWGPIKKKKNDYKSFKINSGMESFFNYLLINVFNNVFFIKNF